MEQRKGFSVASNPSVMPTAHELLVTEIHRLRAAIAEAVTELSDALHTEEHDADGRPLGVCVMCGYRDGSWPCLARMVANDLERALDGS